MRTSDIPGIRFLECFGGPLDGREIVKFNRDYLFPCPGGEYQHAWVTLPALGGESVEMWFWRRDES